MATVFQRVCSEVCKLEGRKSVSRVGDVREIISDFCAVWYSAAQKIGDVYIADVADSIGEMDRMLVRIGKARARKLRKKGHVL